jgi:hypothetical protein
MIMRIEIYAKIIFRRKQFPEFGGFGYNVTGYHANISFEELLYLGASQLDGT